MPTNPVFIAPPVRANWRSAVLGRPDEDRGEDTRGECKAEHGPR